MNFLYVELSNYTLMIVAQDDRKMILQSIDSPHRQLDIQK